MKLKKEKMAIVAIACVMLCVMIATNISFAQHENSTQLANNDQNNQLTKEEYSVDNQILEASNRDGLYVISRSAYNTIWLRNC